MATVELMNSNDYILVNKQQLELVVKGQYGRMSLSRDVDEVVKLLMVAYLGEPLIWHKKCAKEKQIWMSWPVDLRKCHQCCVKTCKCTLDRCDRCKYRFCPKHVHRLSRYSEYIFTSTPSDIKELKLCRKCEYIFTSTPSSSDGDDSDDNDDNSKINDSDDSSFYNYFD